MKTAIFGGDRRGGDEDSNALVAPCLTFTPPHTLSSLSVVGGGTIGRGADHTSHHQAGREHNKQQQQHRRAGGGQAVATATAAVVGGGAGTTGNAVGGGKGSVGGGAGGGGGGNLSTITSPAMPSTPCHNLSVVSHPPPGFRPHVRRASRMTNVSGVAKR